MSTWHADIALAVYFAKTEKRPEKDTSQRTLRLTDAPDLCFSCGKPYRGLPCPHCEAA